MPALPPTPPSPAVLPSPPAPPLPPPAPTSPLSRPPVPPAPVYQSITFPAPAGTTEHYLSVARTLKAGEVITGTFTITDTAEPSKYHESNSATATWYVEAIEASGMRVLIRHDGNAETTLELGLDVVVPFDSTYIVKVGVVSRRAKTVNIKILPAGWQTREVW